MITIALTARPSYARVKTVIEALRDRGLPFRVACSAGTLLRPYGAVIEEVIADFGAPHVVALPTVYAGDSLLTGALSTAAAAEVYAREFAAVPPDLVVVIADRREVLGATIAAVYQNIPVLHLLAGERSGSIDDKVRAAISALATYHACPHQQAAWTLQQARHVRVTGCPSGDLLYRAMDGPAVDLQSCGGTGPLFDLRQPFDVLLWHPDTNHLTDGPAQAKRFLLESDVPLVVIWPGEDPGGEAIAKAYRELAAAHPARLWHFLRHVPAERFYTLLTQARRLLGNSSVGVREARLIPTLEIVNTGHRQDDRAAGVEYGDGHAGATVAEWIEEIVPHDHDHSRAGRIGASAAEKYAPVSARWYDALGSGGAGGDGARQ